MRTHCISQRIDHCREIDRIPGISSAPIVTFPSHPIRRWSYVCHLLGSPCLLPIPKRRQNGSELRAGVPDGRYIVKRPLTPAVDGHFILSKSISTDYQHHLVPAFCIVIPANGFPDNHMWSFDGRNPRAPFRKQGCKEKGTLPQGVEVESELRYRRAARQLPEPWESAKKRACARAFGQPRVM